MKVSLLNPLSYNRVQSNSIEQGRQNTSYSNLSPLKQDTVSFSSKFVPRAGNLMSEILQVQLEAEAERMNRIAKTFLDILGGAVEELKDKGFSMDRKYCEKNPVKSPKSHISKIRRSGSFIVPDRIRATIFCSDIYNLSKLNDLLAALKLRGYVVEDIQKPINKLIKRGYKPTPEEIAMIESGKSIEKVVPDLDIRLNGVAEQVTKLDPRYAYSISSAQASGYEDIQIRFKRNFVDNKKPTILHELIILLGKETSKAKQVEYDDVFSHLRLFGELNQKFADSTPGSNSVRAKRYIELIEQMFRGKVSKKLFDNAKNLDHYGINANIPIVFYPEDMDRFSTYFRNLKRCLNIEYERKISVSSYSSKQSLLEQRDADIALLDKVRDSLRMTIKKYSTAEKNTDKK